jgi:hypothetical protein
VELYLRFPICLHGVVLNRDYFAYIRVKIVFLRVSSVGETLGTACTPRLKYWRGGTHTSLPALQLN